MLWLTAYLTGFPPTGLYTLSWTHGLAPGVFQHLLEAALDRRNILMIGHAIPGIVGFQKLHGHLTFFQLLTDEDRNQVLCFQRITRHFFLEKLFEAFFKCHEEISLVPGVWHVMFKWTDFQTLIAPHTFTFIYPWVFKAFFVLHHRNGFFRTDSITSCTSTAFFFSFI